MLDLIQEGLGHPGIMGLTLAIILLANLAFFIMLGLQFFFLERVGYAECFHCPLFAAMAAAVVAHSIHSYLQEAIIRWTILHQVAVLLSCSVLFFIAIWEWCIKRYDFDPRHFTAIYFLIFLSVYFARIRTLPDSYWQLFLTLSTKSHETGLFFLFSFFTTFILPITLIVLITHAISVRFITAGTHTQTLYANSVFLLLGVWWALMVKAGCCTSSFF